MSYLTAVKVSTQSNADEVLFDIDGSFTHDVRYVPALYQDGSGDLVTVRGEKFLQIVLRNVNGHDLNTGEQTFQMPHINWYYPQLQAVRFLGDFEATVTFGLGLRNRRGFTAAVLTPTGLRVRVNH